MSIPIPSPNPELASAPSPHRLSVLGSGRIWTLQVPFALELGPEVTKEGSLGWEPVFEDSLLPRLGGEIGTERHRGGLLSSPKGLQTELGTRHPSNRQLFQTANGISESCQDSIKGAGLTSVP